MAEGVNNDGEDRDEGVDDKGDATKSGRERKAAATATTTVATLSHLESRVTTLRRRLMGK